MTVPESADAPVLCLPEALARQDVYLRPQTAADREFLHGLYASTRWEELAPSGWPDAAKIGFLRQQSDLQLKHYDKFYQDGGAFWLITLGGDPIGRLYVFRGGGEIRVVDLSLVPPARGRGYGAALLTAVQVEAAEQDWSVSIHVERNNRARNLYRRLGFVVTEEHGVYLRMDWYPIGGKRSLARLS